MCTNWAINWPNFNWRGPSKWTIFSWRVTPDRNRRRDESWYRFLRSHGTRFFACDFLTVDTAFLKRLYVFALMDTSTRQIISVAVTRHPTAVWLENVLRSALMDIKDCPKFIVSDRDGIYGEWLGTFLKDCYDITLYRSKILHAQNMEKLILIEQRFSVSAWLTG